MVLWAQIIIDEGVLEAKGMGNNHSPSTSLRCCVVLLCDRHPCWVLFASGAALPCRLDCWLAKAFQPTHRCARARFVEETTSEREERLVRPRLHFNACFLPTTTDLLLRVIARKDGLAHRWLTSQEGALTVAFMPTMF